MEHGGGGEPQPRPGSRSVVSFPWVTSSRFMLIHLHSSARRNALDRSQNPPLHSSPRDVVAQDEQSPQRTPPSRPPTSQKPSSMSQHPQPQLWKPRIPPETITKQPPQPSSSGLYTGARRPSPPLARTVGPSPTPSARPTPLAATRQKPNMWKPPVQTKPEPSGVTRSLQRAANSSTTSGAAGNSSDHPRIGVRAGASPPSVRTPVTAQGIKQTASAPVTRAAPPAMSTPASHRVVQASAALARPSLPPATSASTSASSRPIPTQPSPAAAVSADVVNGPSSASASSAQSWSEVDDGVSGSSHGSAHMVYAGPRASRRREVENADDKDHAGDPDEEDVTIRTKMRQEELRRREEELRVLEAKLQARDEALKRRDEVFHENAHRHSETIRAREDAVRALQSDVTRREEEIKLREDALVQKKQAFAIRVAEDSRRVEQLDRQETHRVSVAEAGRAKNEELARAIAEDSRRLEAERERFGEERARLEATRKSFEQEREAFRFRVAQFDAQEEALRRGEQVSTGQHQGDAANGGAVPGTLSYTWCKDFPLTYFQSPSRLRPLQTKRTKLCTTRFWPRLKDWNAKRSHSRMHVCRIVTRSQNSSGSSRGASVASQTSSR